MRSKKPILVVEDDEVDVMTLKRACKELRIANPVLVAEDGELALDLLRTGERPCLIMLDINMPRMNGIELLRVLKADDALKHIPVVMLTTSKEESDKLASFRLSVAGYMLKPVDYAQFVELMRTINLYWTLSEIPD